MSNPQGIRLPAEWEPQSGVMLTWPHEGGEWGGRLGGTYAVLAQIGAAITAHEKLLSVCQSHGHAATVRQLLLESGARPDAGHRRPGLGTIETPPRAQLDFPN